MRFAGWINLREAFPEQVPASRDSRQARKEDRRPDGIACARDEQTGSRKDHAEQEEPKEDPPNRDHLPSAVSTATPEHET